MQTPKLSAAQRAWMNDPKGFEKRMRERAEQLFTEGYIVEPGNEIGLFLVTTPKREVYPVNVLTISCGCPYQQKAEIPQVPCKHLHGIEGLVKETLSNLMTGIQIGDPRQADTRREEYRRLEAHWQATEEAQEQALCERYEAQEAGRAMAEADAIDSALRGSYGVEF